MATAYRIDALADTATKRPSAPSPLSRLYRRYEHAILGGLFVLVFLVFWEGLSRGWWADLLQPLIGDAARVLRVRPIFVSSPTRILTRFVQMTASGEIWEHLYASGVAFVLGGALAVAFGIPLGLAAGWYRRFGYAIAPFLTMYNATPQIIFLPLLIIWTGTGLLTRVLIIAMLTFVPLTMSALAAVKTTDARLIRVAKSFNSSDWRRFRDIILPTSVPFLLSGMRLGVGRAMVGIVVSEIYAAGAGIGYLMNVSGASFQTDRVFVGILVIAVIGLLLTGAIHMIERRVEAWRPRAS
jgi:NitT/TauT family transport system permease protein